MGSNLNKVAAKSDKPAENPRNKKRNNPSRVRRNARRLQSFLDRKRSSEIKYELMSAIDSSPIDHGPTLDNQDNGEAVS